MNRRSLMASTVALLLAGSASGGPVASVASAASVDVMVVGRSEVLKPPARVRLKTRSVAVGARRCAVGAATPLAALLGTRLRIALRDYGSCGRSPRDAGGLFVRRVGAEGNRGRDGWVYKVGRRAGTTGAADFAGAFGDGRRLRSGQSVLWFWCVMSADDGCQRTLEVSTAARTVRPGEPLRVRVRGYDDRGRAAAVAGATVGLLGASAVTGPDGFASLVVPPTGGAARVTAEKPGLVPAIGRRVVVR